MKELPTKQEVTDYLTKGYSDEELNNRHFDILTFLQGFDLRAVMVAVAWHMETYPDER